MTLDDKIAWIKELLPKITQGEWTSSGLSVVAHGRGVIASIPTPSRGVGVFECEINGTFIALSRNTIADLIAEVERLRKAED